MGEERDTLEDVIEPFLLQTAMVTRTRQGRRATKLAYEHLGLKYVPPQNPNAPVIAPDAPLFDNEDGQQGRTDKTAKKRSDEKPGEKRKDDRKP
jgi:hypothetical protein